MPGRTPATGLAPPYIEVLKTWQPAQLSTVPLHPQSLRIRSWPDVRYWYILCFAITALLFATVWQNGEHYNTVLSKSYKDGDEWKNTDQLSTGDLMNAVRVIQPAEDFISTQV
jgi:hypothetical protein